MICDHVRPRAPDAQSGAEASADAACLDGETRPAPLWRSCRLQRASPDKIYAQTASADPTLHAQLHRATMFQARNGPHIAHSASVFPKTVLYLKAEKVGNSGQ